MLRDHNMCMNLLCGQSHKHGWLWLKASEGRATKKSELLPQSKGWWAGKCHCGCLSSYITTINIPLTQRQEQYCHQDCGDCYTSCFLSPQKRESLTFYWYTTRCILSIFDANQCFYIIFACGLQSFSGKKNHRPEFPQVKIISAFTGAIESFEVVGMTSW
jgi:hypothetical protein